MTRKLVIKPGKIKFRKKWVIPPGDKTIKSKKDKIAARERQIIKATLRRRGCL